MLPARTRQELEAESYAHQAFAAHGMRMPPQVTRWGRAYVGQWVAADHAAGLPIDPRAEAYVNGTRSPYEPLRAVPATWRQASSSLLTLPPFGASRGEHRRSVWQEIKGYAAHLINDLFRGLALGVAVFIAAINWDTSLMPADPYSIEAKLRAYGVVLAVSLMFSVGRMAWRTRRDFLTQCPTDVPMGHWAEAMGHSVGIVAYAVATSLRACRNVLSRRGRNESRNAHLD